jgi:hypothetical protein
MTVGAALIDRGLTLERGDVMLARFRGHVVDVKAVFGEIKPERDTAGSGCLEQIGQLGLESLHNL